MRALRIFILLGPILGLGAADEGVSVVHIVGLSYPLLAHFGELQGTVKLALTVGPDGAVRSVRRVSGNGLLADDATNTLMVWTFSHCGRDSGNCEYPMSVEFVLRSGPANISECKTEFTFDNPGRITVVSEHARAIVD